VVEFLPSKQAVAGSNPVSRSNWLQNSPNLALFFILCHLSKKQVVAKKRQFERNKQKPTTCLKINYSEKCHLLA
jgi:hypothetical protein